MLIPYDNREQKKALDYLYKELKRARRAMVYAEYKSHSLDEIQNIHNKIDTLEWLIDVARDVKEETRWRMT